MKSDEAAKMLLYLAWHQSLEKLTDEELMTKILAAAPIMGELGEMIEVLAERLYPGILQRIVDKENNEPKAL